MYGFMQFTTKHKYLHPVCKSVYFSQAFLHICENKRHSQKYLKLTLPFHLQFIYICLLIYLFIYFLLQTCPFLLFRGFSSVTSDYTQTQSKISCQSIFNKKCPRHTDKILLIFNEMLKHFKENFKENFVSNAYRWLEKLRLGSNLKV